jgi:hypothetical protein
MKLQWPGNWWAFAAVGITLIWGITFYNAWMPWPKNGHNDYNELMTWRGTFGDAFGVTTSLFSALTLIGVMYGVILQRQELSEAQRSWKAQKFEEMFHFLISNIPQSRECVTVGNLRGVSAVEWLSIHYNDNQFSASRSYVFSIINAIILVEENRVYANDLHARIIKGIITEADELLIDKFITEYRTKFPDSEYGRVHDRWFADEAINKGGGLPSL